MILVLPLFAASLILHSAAIAADRMFDIGKAELGYKIALIVCSFGLYSFSYNILYAILMAIVMKLCLLSKGFYTLSLNFEIFKLSDRVKDIYEIRWWVLSQTLMVIGGFLPYFSIQQLFSEKLFGFYLLSISIFFGASSLAGKAFADVVFSYINDIVFVKKIIERVFVLFSLAFGLFFMIYFHSKELILSVMGVDWSGFHETSMFILVLSYASFLSNCFDKLPQYFKNESYTFIFNISRLLLNLSVLSATLMLEFDFYEFLFWTTIVNSALYFFDLIYIYCIVRRHAYSI
ncbi:hypothetical protein N8349_01700 [Gammaproteobacteria bacterium]|nr:hypothetical protein [Gammaproteobacteria bacterium]